MDDITQTLSDADPTAHLIDTLYAKPPRRFVLPNGLTLLHQPDFSSEVMSVQVWVKTGSMHEGASLGSGLSHYLEHLLFKGTQRRSAKSISREVHAMGGNINAYTTFDRTVYYIDGPASAFSAALDVLEDITLHALLPEREVERERDVILREIDMGLDDPDRVLSQMLFRTAYRTHPYREPVIGHRELFEGVSRDELIDYYQRRYVPNNMVLAVAGAVTEDELDARIETTFAKAPRRRMPPVLVPGEPDQLAERREHVEAAHNVLRGGLGFKVPHLSHADAPALDVLAHALGGGESSLLWQELRNRRKLVHAIDARNWCPGERGLMWLSYVCDPGRAPEVEPAIRSLLVALAESGLDDSVIEKARRQALAAEINGRKTMSGQAGRMALAEVVIGDLAYPRHYFERLGRVDSAALQRVAAEYLVPAGLTVVTLGPEPAMLAKGGVDARTAHQAFNVCAYSSGSRLLLQPDHRLPKVHLRAVLRAGPLYEPASQRGVSSLLATLLTRDTETRSGETIAREVESIGGSFSASAGNNTLTLAIEVLPQDLRLAVELLSDALLRPGFVETTFEVERDAQIGELREEDDEILEYGFRILRERFFGTHPFAVAAAGRISDLERLTPDDVRAHYGEIARASNLVLAASGDFDPAELKALLQPLMEGGLADGSVTSAPAEGVLPATVEDQFETMKREQAVVLQAFPDVGLDPDQGVAAELLNELFSGMSSRLFERVREDKGLAYYIGSTRIVGLDTGAFVFYAGTHPEAADEVAKEIDGELARVAAGDVLADELERCRTRLKASRVMGRQTIGARALNAALRTLYGFPINDDAEYAAKLDALDAPALAKFVRTYLCKERRVQLVVGPERKS